MKLIILTLLFISCGKPIDTGCKYNDEQLNTCIDNERILDGDIRTTQDYADWCHSKLTTCGNGKG